MESFDRKYEISTTAILKFIQVATLSISAAKSAANLISKLNLVDADKDIYLSSYQLLYGMTIDKSICKYYCQQDFSIPRLEVIKYCGGKYIIY